MKEKWNKDINNYDAIIVNGGDCNEYASEINRDGFRPGSFMAMNYGPELLGYVVGCEFDVHRNIKEATPIGFVNMKKRKHFYQVDERFV